MDKLRETLIHYTDEHILSVLFALLVISLLLLFLVDRKKNKKRELAVKRQPEKRVVTPHLHQSEATNKTAFTKLHNVLSDAILVLSKSNKVTYINQPMIKFLNTQENCLGQKLKEMPLVYYMEQKAPLDKFIAEQIKQDKRDMHIYPNISLMLDGERGPKTPVYLYIDQQSDREWHNYILVRNSYEGKMYEEYALKHRLTLLPNQKQFEMDYSAMITKSDAQNKKIILVLISIDQFAKFRVILGHEHADRVYIGVAQYLSNLQKHHQFKLYHTFHDNFLLGFTGAEEIQDVIVLVKKIQKEILNFYKVDKTRLYLTVSAGIGVYPDHATRRTLFDVTFQALQEAQQRGYGHYKVYVEKIKKKEYDELVLFGQMHDALKQKQFEAYFQPVVDSQTKEVVAAEALIRWRHPEYGLIPPGIFIPIMEKTSYIAEIGEYMAIEVIKQLKRWELFGFKKIQVAVNLSLLELEDGGFADRIEAHLKYHKVNPKQLKFEITEGSAMQGEEKTLKEIRKLKKLGIAIALDDFGTGYTSFSHLKTFPADTVKIDKSMIDHILSSKEDQRIVKAMIDMSHGLGMNVVVEGIEDKRAFEMIASLGGDLIQGYYISKPLPVFEFQEFLRP